MSQTGIAPAAGASVRARGWGWRHAGRRAAAVAELDVQIAPGERVLLLGASGAGKSTLLHALAGVLGGDDEGDASGELLVDGRPAAERCTRTALVLQDPDSQVVMARVGDDVAFGCENLGVPADEIWPRVRRALDEVGLDLPLDASTAQLSGGQKQRLALAGALAMRPALLLLDEPTANLDPAGVVDVRDSVARALEHTSATLVVVEHRVDVWQHLVDRIIVLAPGGGVLAEGPPEAVLAEHGDELSRGGVWVPGHPPAAPSRRRNVGGPLLLADGLSVGRTAFAAREPVVVADEIRAELSEGACLAVTGPNGAGKSTFALTVAGLLPPVAGSLEATPVLAAGRGGHPHRWRSRDLLTRIGTVFQDPEHQFLTATVRDELAVGPRAVKMPAERAGARIDELLDRLRLTRLAGANPFTLSGGEKRRLSVATVLATAPRVVVLDEPTFGQDSRTWSELAALLADLLDGGTSLVAVTHDADFVAVLADDTIELGRAEHQVVAR